MMAMAVAMLAYTVCMTGMIRVCAQSKTESLALSVL